MKRRTSSRPSTFIHAPVCKSVDAQEAFDIAAKAQQDMLPELITKAVTEVEGTMPDDATVAQHGKLSVKDNRYVFHWKGKLRFTVGVIAQSEDMERPDAGGVN